MAYLPAELHRYIVERAGERCEYCRLNQSGQEATFHVDHIVPKAAGGSTDADNLALACVSCSLHKAARELAEDPVSGELVRLFHPRREAWSQHFQWRGCVLEGLTEVGRATIAALKMNRPLILAIREEEMKRGRHE